MEIKIGGRSNGQSIYNAIKFLDYINNIPENKMYGIIKTKRITILTKQEVISIQKVENKIEELNKRIKQIEKDSKYCSDRAEGRIMSDELYTLKRMRDILQELLESEE